ncbi:MAG TPA: (2Fe-2S) ferredoxin domain-containing protein [Armatimonadota bacterium]|jgi:NADH:ubiquinone oxidoreductase subunit E|nr:(2Fe-2S) ferredoxin domain-containing protein [Armatimonadota bacterium]
MPSEKRDMFLCMGSACHQAGVYDVLPKLQKLLAENGLDDTIELKGAFCLGPCTKGIVLTFEDHVFTRLSPANVEHQFRTKILPVLK